MPANPGHLPPPSVIAEQERMAYRLHLHRLPHEEIARRLDLSVATVKRRIEAGREAYTRPDEIEILRQDLGAQLDEEYRTVSTVQAGASDPKIKLAASAQLVKINESYRKLYAVDSPTPLEAALTARAELEGELIAGAVEAAVRGVIDAADVDVEFAARLKLYAFELAARQLERADGQEPEGPDPVPPKPRLAITAGRPEGPSDKIEETGGPSVPHPRRRDAATTILDQARALLEEDDEDADEEDDQG
ncbi:sigma factor-like helix-turn-helix DNA-binding protein [Streptomyces sp. GbtcB6]|uniref:sigma-70 region 4 domain-containing protein n=1 Tax=Streptomyces sp. GbtcB6 TaxID=2824751 RepID=UPI001C3086ED|nr:sigma-70 region 4 domain-containing protein [Streptomyces sp. GbtcB6]